MKITRPQNTKERGVFEIFVYPEKKKFVGVCLTFDIVEEGNSLQDVSKNILEAALLHIESVVKNELPDELLNRYAPEEYWTKYFSFQDALKDALKKKYFEKMVGEAIQQAYNCDQLFNASRTS